MIAGVPAEKPRAGGFSDEEAEQVEIEASARLEVCRVETKVAEPANLKRAVQGNTADVVFGRIHHCHDNLSPRVFSLKRDLRHVARGLFAQSHWRCEIPLCNMAIP